LDPTEPPATCKGEEESETKGKKKKQIRSSRCVVFPAAAREPASRYCTRDP